MDLAHISDMDLAQYWDCCSEQGLHLLDTVHGSIQLGPVVKQLYHTPAVQRLGQLQQLGCCSVAFPGAVHTRLQHSVGTAHAAVAALKHLAATGQRVTPLDVELISLAGICHDMGHGPFSHMFESLFLPAVGIKHWHHEDMSVQLLQFTVDTCSIDISQQQLHFVQDAINGSCADWRCQIVANKQNSIDVDKIDYLLRDSIMAGLVQQHDFRALLSSFKVIDQDICYSEHQQGNIAALFDARAAMHAEVYQQPVAKAAELMIVDAMKAADPVLQISSKIHSPASFLTLADGVGDTIQLQAQAHPQNPHLQHAAAIIRRMEQREYYVWVAELTVPREAALCGSHHDDSCWLSAADVAAWQDHNLGVTLQQDDVRLQNVYIDYCKGPLDPLDSVLLHSADSCTGAVSTWPASRGMARPDAFVKQQVRVYLARCCQGPEQRRYMHAVRTAFSRAAQHRFGFGIHICSSECSCPLSWRKETGHKVPQQQQHAINVQQQQQHVSNGELPSPQPLMKARVLISSGQGSVQRKVFAGSVTAAESRRDADSSFM